MKVACRLPNFTSIVDIGAFFEAMPDTEQGVAGVAEHLTKFWEPRMRAALKAVAVASRDG